MYKNDNMYIEIIYLREDINTISIIPIHTLEEGRDIATVIRKYNNPEDCLIKIKKKGKVIQ